MVRKLPCKVLFHTKLTLIHQQAFWSKWDLQLHSTLLRICHVFPAIVQASLACLVSADVSVCWSCRDALSQLLGPVKLHLEELVVERCTDFLSVGVHHFSPLASLSRLKVSLQHRKSCLCLATGCVHL